MNGIRFAMFIFLVLSIWGLIHCHVFWRLASVPWIASYVSRKALVIIGVALWLSYLLARWLGSSAFNAIASSLEFFATTWMGVLFLLFAALLLVDIFTLGGVLFPERVRSIRGWAVIVAMGLALVALVQGLRAPVITRHEVSMAGWPESLNGMTLVGVSDLHLGRLIGKRWLAHRVRQINDLAPDCVVAVGDVVDGNVHQIQPLVPLLQQLQAPLGVWAVTGNHEYYVGLEPSVQLLEQAGWRVLRDESVELAPGLVFAGVDDLTARPPLKDGVSPVQAVLQDRPYGCTILLSHSPLEVEMAAAMGVQLMLSGHTHAGQMWPFNYLVALRYPLISGRYYVDGMPLIVCRGTGTWGPRMRLWRRSEILHLTLRGAH